MEYREIKKLIKWPRKGLIESLLNKLLASPFVVGNEVIRSHLKQGHLYRWKTCKVCRQSETLMSGPLPSRTKEPQAMSRRKLKVAVVLLTGHTTLRSRMFKFGLTQRQDCRLCWDEKTAYIAYVIVRLWHARDTEPLVLCSWRRRI